MNAPYDNVNASTTPTATPASPGSGKRGHKANFESALRALAHHRHCLDGLLLSAITEAAASLAAAAVGHSPFHNDHEFRAACKLLDLLPLLQHPHDIEMRALDQAEEREKRREREREREPEREPEQPPGTET